MEEVMPFGRYKGRLVSEIPKWYLQWIARQERLDEALRASIEDVLGQEPIPELSPPRRAWKPDCDRIHLAPDLEARIHAVVKDTSYWLAQLRRSGQRPDTSQ